MRIYVVTTSFHKIKKKEKNLWGFLCHLFQPFIMGKYLSISMICYFSLLKMAPKICHNSNAEFRLIKIIYHGVEFVKIFSEIWARHYSFSGFHQINISSQRIDFSIMGQKPRIKKMVSIKFLLEFLLSK